MRVLLIAAVVSLAACTTTPEQQAAAAAEAAEASGELEKELAGLVPGEPSDCLPISQRTNLSSQTFGETIVYRASNGLKFRNDTTGGCEAAGDRGSILITQTPIGRYCRGDIVQTVDPVTRIPTGSCALGSFVPYRKPS